MNTNKKIITDIQIQKKDNKRRSIYINGVFAFGLTDVDVLYYKLEIDKELPEEKYEQILYSTIYERSKSIALNFLSRRMRSEKEVYNKLIEKEINDEIIQKTIDFLKKYNYINDEIFVKHYIKDKLNLKGHGKKKIVYDLKELGIDINIIENYFDENYDFIESEEETALKLARKKAKNLDLTDFKQKKKLNDFLLRRGFSYDIIKSTIEKLSNSYE